MLLRLDILTAEAAAGIADSLAKQDMVHTRPEVETGYVELDNNAPATRDAGRLLIDALRMNPLFLLGVQPRNFSQPVIRRSDAGMTSQPGVRDAPIEGARIVRADVVVAVFLSDPASYEGGEFFVDTGHGDESYKEPAGTCLVFPISARHSIAPVRKGSRLGGELSVQSFVRDDAQRQILYDLGCSLQYLELLAGSADPDTERLRKCQQSLLRFWTD
jgi:PKHD-type hydroxylase